MLLIRRDFFKTVMFLALCVISSRDAFAQQQTITLPCPTSSRKHLGNVKTSTFKHEVASNRGFASQNEAFDPGIMDVLPARIADKHDGEYKCASSCTLTFSAEENFGQGQKTLHRLYSKFIKLPNPADPGKPWQCSACQFKYKKYVACVKPSPNQSVSYSFDIEYVDNTPDFTPIWILQLPWDDDSVKMDIFVAAPEEV